MICVIDLKGFDIFFMNALAPEQVDSSLSLYSTLLFGGISVIRFSYTKLIIYSCFCEEYKTHSSVPAYNKAVVSLMIFKRAD